MSIPSDLRMLYKEIELLSSIPQDHKVNLNSFSYSQNNWRGNLYRYFNGESHQNVIEKMRDIINKAIIYNQQYPNYRHEILERLTKLRDSLPIYKKVYAQRIDTIADLNIIDAEIMRLNIEKKKLIR